MDKKGNKWTAVDTLYWLGGLLVSGGIALALPCAGLIAAGAFCLVGAWLTDRSRGGGESE